MAKFKSASSMTDEEIRARQKELRKPISKRTKVVPSHTEDAKVRTRQARAQQRGQVAKSTRATTGNQPTARLRDAFKGKAAKLRAAARGAAGGLGELGGATVAETAGLVKEGAKGFGRGSGITGQAADVAKKGVSKASAGLNAAKTAAGRLGSSGFVQGAKLLAKGGGAAVGLAADVVTNPAQDIGSRLERQNPLTAGPAAIKDFAARRFAGQGLGQAFRGTARGALAPISLGFVDEPTDDPQRPGDRGPSLFEKATARFGNQPDDIGGQVQGAQTPANVPQGPIPGTPGGARGAFTQAPVEGPPAPRAGGLVPPPGTGSFTNERTGAVTNLNFPQEEQGLRGAQQQAPAQTQNEELTQTLADQARGGGLSSAFGAIASGGNVLREQAANRQRQFQTQEAAQTQQNKIEIELTKAAAKAGPERQQFFADESRALREDLATAEAADDDGVSLNRVKDSLAASALRDINGPGAAIFSGIVSEELTAFVENTGFLDLLGLGTGRNLFDRLSENKEPVFTLNPEKGVFFDREKEAIFKKSETQGEGPQRIVDFKALPKRTKDFFRAKGIFVGKNKEGKRGLQLGGGAASGRLVPQVGLRQ